MRGWFNIATLRLVLGALFLALLIPSVVLVQQAFQQLEYEAFFQHRLLAVELATRIDQGLVAQIEREEARSFADYQFLVVTGNPAANFVERSPLSTFPVSKALPGLVGYFQIDAQGKITTPLVPADVDDVEALGVSTVELAARLALQSQITDILREPQSKQRQREQLPEQDAEVDLANLAMTAEMTGEMAEEMKKEASEATAPFTSSAAAPAGSAVAPDDQLEQEFFDRFGERSALSSAAGKVSDLRLNTYAVKSDAPAPASQAYAARDAVVAPARYRAKRVEQNVVAEPARKLAKDNAAFSPATMFESEIDPFSFGILDDVHFVLFRNVWRDGQRTIQGAIIQRAAFISSAVASVYNNTVLSRRTNLVVGYDDAVLQVFGPSASSSSSASGASGTSEILLHETRLSAPLAGLVLIFSVSELPLGSGASVVSWVAIILITILCLGFAVLYRLGVGQINLNRQQQDFVSAVSHELKTPLTSIRMYGEMLKSGWVSEDKKRSYYDFIFDESERLSRLISNVLQLARLTRNRAEVELTWLTVRELMDTVVSKISTQVERAGFEFESDCQDAALGATVNVDSDAFAQVLINLVDNAIKFSAKSEVNRIELKVSAPSDSTVVVSVRDFGPGVPTDQMRKIFRLFYRPQSELTRDTVGTGIGLALVKELVAAMQGRIDVTNRNPGAEFRVTLDSRAPTPSS